MKQWKRLAALSSAIVMAAATLTYFPNDTLQNIRLELSASAGTTTEPQVWNEDNLTWTLYADGKLTISGTGAMKDYNAAENLSPAYMNSDVKKVVIEDGVTSIGELAFFKCSNLTNITIPDSVTCIEYAAFHGCSSLSSITIPNSVTSIGVYAFVICSSLTSITIPDGVTSIGYGAFSECSSLKTISLSCKSSLKKSDFGEQANLVSYTNQHLLTKTAAKAATCAESGNKAYWTCEHCGKYFLSDDANPATATAVELSETVIPALNHKNATTRGAVKPTETEPGYSGDRYCPDCDTVFEKGYTYWNEGNLTWKLDADGTLTISGTGTMKDYDNGDNPSPVCNNSNVKKVVIEDGVTNIGNWAFSECSSLTSITIPDSVTSIGAYAFAGCYDLTSITIPESVTNIGNGAFLACGLTSITIPNSVTSIGDWTFYNCSDLISITIPDGVTSIGTDVFQGCTGLTSIILPENVTSIGDYAFYGCNNLTSITIPDSVTSIGNSVFSDCGSLTTISLSCGSALKKSDFGGQADLVSYTLHTLKKTEAKTVTCAEDGNKEYWTCEHCKKYFLSDDANPETAKAVEQSEFIIPALKHKNATTRGASEPNGTKPGYSGDRYCPDCDTVLEKGYTYWKEDNLTWKLDADGTLTISGTGAMKDYNSDDNPSPASQKKDSVKKVVIEDGVTSIGDSAFSYCSSLTNITIPDSVTSIGDSAFSGCWDLTSITIPDSITTIGESAFYGCSSLTSITIPNSVTSIGAYAFSSCRSLTSITIPDSVTSIGNSSFSYCISLTSITIPNSVTSIGAYAFSNCWYLTSITIPDSVTSIGKSAFYKCSSLKTISLSCKSSLKRSDFGDQANLVSYTSHTLNKTEAKAATCTENGNKEYWTCEHCKKYFLSDDANPETAKAVEKSETIIPASHKLTKVEAKAPTCAEDGNKAYWTCEHCGKYFLSDDANPETAKAVELSETVIPALKHKNAYIRDISKPTETAPGYSGDRYCPDCDTVLKKGYTYWNEGNLTWKLDADGTLTISGTGKMKNYNDTNKLSPVCRNSSVKKVVIEDGVTSIGAYAFYSCDNSISITIPSSVTSIGDEAFTDCGLTSITIPSSVTSIGDFAFNSCGSLTSITIPDSVTSIGSYAFTSCSSLTSITIPDSVTSIGDWTFYNCSSLTSITIPDSVTSIGDSAFAYCERLTSITIPDRVTSIEPYAFRDCKSLTSITIPDGVTSIGNYAFYNCSSLTSITIPDGVTSIGKDAFNNCDSLQTISLGCGSALKKSDFGKQADLVSYTNQHTLTKTAAKAKTCTEDGNKEYWTCEHCKKYFLSNDTNPETAKAVEQSEFIIPASHKLTKVEAKDATCAENGNKAYWTCEHCGKYFLSDDTNPETAKAVELSETILPALKHKNETIRGASKPDGTKPGYSGDRYCPDCDTVLEKGYTYWNEGNLTWKLDADGTLTISGTGAMKDYDIEDNESPVFKNLNVKKIVIEDGVTNIGNYAFDCCTGLTSITIPDSVTSIGDYALQSCTNLTSITIPDSVTSIGAHAFSNCYKLISITLPSSITSIGEWLFAGCGDLTSITIPDSVTSIGDYAFYYCYQLTSITLSSNITRIGDDAFGYCNNLKSITIPDGVTSIGYDAFKNCSNLKTISLSCGSALKKSDFGGQANLVSYTNQHTLTKTAAKAATCTEDGNKEYWTCEHCGKYFLSDDANPETAKAVELSETVIPASHELTKVNAKAATCTEDGNIEYWQCDVCKKTFTDEAGKNAVDNVIIPALKHSYNENGFCENDDTHYQPANYNEEIEKYEISNAGQLYWFAEQVNSGNASVNAVLTTDIVVNEGNLATYDGTSPNTWMTWTPIGNGASRRVYSGIFDGQGHTISGLYVNSNDNYIGLFGVVMSGSNIKNIGVINSYFKGNDFVGGIAGTVNESSFVQNCYSINTISGNDYIGGICGAFGSNNTDIKKCYAVCNIHPSEKATHVGGVIASGEYVNISDCYYDSDIFSGKAYTDIFSSANAKNVEGKTTAQFASGEVTYLLNDDQSNIIFYQDLATEKYPTLNQKSKVVMQLEMIYDESFGEDATTNKTYHNAGDTVALETSPDKAYTYQYFVDGKQIEEPTYTLTGNTKMTVKSVPVEIELSEIDTIQLTYQKKTKLDLTVYIKNFADLKPMQFQLDADSKLPEGLTLEEDGILSGIPEKAAENVKTTLILTAKNGTTKNMELTFHIAKAEPTVEVAVSGDSHTEGDLVGELELILSENSTKGVVELVSEIKALVAGKNTFTWKFTPEDENNYHTVTGTVVVNAQTTTTTTTTTKATTTTTKATTTTAKATTKPSKTTTTKATTTTKPNKTTTTKVTTTTKPNKTTTTKATTTTKPSKTTTTKATTTTKPSKTTTTNATTTTKPNKTTTTKVTTTTKPNKTTTTKATTTTKPSKTTTTKATTTTKPNKTTTTKVTTTTKPNKTTTTKATTTTKPSKTTTTKATTTTKPSKTTTTKATTTTKPSKTTTTKATTTTKPSKTTTTNVTTTTKPSKATTTTKPSKTTTTKATTTTKPSKTTTTKATTTNTAIPSYGDVNLDGKVDILDAVYLNKYLATLVQFSDAQIANADCYQDGVLNDQDTTALMQFIVLLIDDLPTQPNQK